MQHEWSRLYHFLAVVISDLKKIIVCRSRDRAFCTCFDGLSTAGPFVFSGFQLPTIRRKLIKAIDFSSQNEVSFLILQFFDDYVGEVRKHMEYENEKVFTYVRGLLNGERSAQYNIGVFARHHDQVNAKLTELKNIIIKYYPPTAIISC